MPRKDKGSKPTKGQNNSENNFHIGSPFVSRKPNPTQTHHVGTIHLDSCNNSSGVDQLVERSTSKRGIMVDQEDHLEGTGDN